MSLNASMAINNCAASDIADAARCLCFDRPVYLSDQTINVFDRLFGVKVLS